jgi:RecB family exonuclease
MWTVDPVKIITAAQKAAEERAALQAHYSAAIQAHLDATARERLYDGIQTAITYRDDPNPQFAAEGEALFTWRSAVWTYATEELAKVINGERTQPSVEQFLDELPSFHWQP